jgi:hypothetical protein
MRISGLSAGGGRAPKLSLDARARRVAPRLPLWLRWRIEEASHFRCLSRSPRGARRCDAATDIRARIRRFLPPPHLPCGVGWHGIHRADLGQASTAPLEAVGYPPPEPFRVNAADGTTDLHGVLYRPADFDAARRYPIIDFIYAGPFLAVHQITYAPSSAMYRVSAALAQMGFVVAMLDARGTPGRAKRSGRELRPHRRNRDCRSRRRGSVSWPDAWSRR